MTNKQIAPALAVGLLLAGAVDSRALEGQFRGMYVCSKLPTTRDILSTPIDLVVHGNAVQFARPLFNLNGTRVVGSELAAGTIDGDGTLHLTSAWSYLGNSAKANYTGRLTSEGGTLTGAQNWSGPDGVAPLSRPCTAALVPTPEILGVSHRDDTRSGTGSTEDQP